MCAWCAVHWFSPDRVRNSATTAARHPRGRERRIRRVHPVLTRDRPITMPRRQRRVRFATPTPAQALSWRNSRAERVTKMCVRRPAGMSPVSATALLAAAKGRARWTASFHERAQLAPRSIVPVLDALLTRQLLLSDKIGSQMLPESDPNRGSWDRGLETRSLTYGFVVVELRGSDPFDANESPAVGRCGSPVLDSRSMACVERSTKPCLAPCRWTMAPHLAPVTWLRRCEREWPVPCHIRSDRRVLAWDDGPPASPRRVRRSARRQPVAVRALIRVRRSPRGPCGGRARPCAGRCAGSSRCRSGSSKVIRVPDW